MKFKVTTKAQADAPFILLWWLTVNRDAFSVTTMETIHLLQIQLGLLKLYEKKFNTWLLAVK